MAISYRCHECGEKYTLDTRAFRCECGGLFDLEKAELKFTSGQIAQDEWSLFRYIHALPFESSRSVWKELSMGEGMTPILTLDPEMPNVMVKLDYAMPTLSFKDRGAVVLIAKAKELGIKKVIQDSSGNAGTSIAAYASRAGMECDIFVPEATSTKKIKQISAHGAKVHIVNGTREDTAAAALHAVEKGHAFYASHVYNPFFYEGTKTFAYEIYEQLKGVVPDSIFVPLGNGTLVLGCYYGFLELLQLKLIKKMPRIIAVQAEGCAPIYQAFIRGDQSIKEVVNTGTLAEGIAIANPLRGKQVLEAIQETAGKIIIAPEDQILDAKKVLAERGFFVETTTAATFAGFYDIYEKENYDSLGSVLIPLCGAGLKSAE
ncbi:threonine synthase [Gottschalkiaceae bacterium SANA]|nr:threonine synthase [Gottschalkiaceae bacterium SANA]